MILYHGSNVPVERPDIVHSRRSVDFGPGFYLTPLREQAEKWCRKYKDKGQAAIVSMYTLEDRAFEESKTLRFDSYSAEWLDFILTCRRGRDESDYEIVMGGVANDKVYNTVELFFDGLIDREEAIRRLRYEKPNGQIALRSQRVIDDYLRFDGSFSV